MKWLAFLSVALLFSGEEIPFKQKEEYELKLEFQFRQRPVESSTYKMDVDYKKTPQAGPLPYLFVHLVVVKQQDDEVKVRIETNSGKNILQRKIEKGKKVTVDLGFTDDLKDNTVPNEYSFLFVGADKQVKRRVLINFESDGTYLVNGEKRGKI